MNSKKNSQSPIPSDLRDVKKARKPKLATLGPVSLQLSTFPKNGVGSI